MEGLGVGGLAAEADHDEQVTLLGGEARGEGEREPEGDGKGAPHASPRRRRYPHSAETRPTARRYSAGMSQSGLRSSMVAPPPA